MASSLVCHMRTLLFTFCLFFIIVKVYANPSYKFNSDHLQDLRNEHIFIETLVSRHKRTITIQADDEEIKREFYENDTSITIQHDSFKYYTSAIVNPDNWEDILPYEETKLEPTLSTTYLRAVPISLSFEFPFYGHLIKNITLTTGGFLYTGSQYHQWLPVTQYIAPLMSNFDPSLHPDSSVYYYDNGTVFIVLWKEVILKDRPFAGNFTFQAALHKNGEIVFSYKQISVSVSLNMSSNHPVKIGLSDAYYIDNTVLNSKRRTIFEYDRVELNMTGVSNLCAIYLHPLPNCITIKTCTECNAANISLLCGWCEPLKRCSDGFDRHRQDWLDKKCSESGITMCPKPSVNGKYNSRHNFSYTDGYLTLNTASIIGILLVLVCIVGLIIWVVYAYKYPQSSSGQFLIRYRPSQWRWKWNDGEAKYTAASSVHI